MSTINANSTNPPTITLDDGHCVDKAVFVGASMLGHVYRSAQGRGWYRVVPIENASIEWRHSIRSPAPDAPQSLLAARRDWQQTIDGSTQLVFLYAADESSQTLAELINSGDPVGRLKGAASLVRVLQQWWQTIPSPLFPLPADVVVSKSGETRLLWIPRGELPNSETVIAEPQRALYLSPELLRSAINVAWDTASWEAVDRYAVAVCLLSCFCQLPSTSRVGTALFRGATGSLLNKLPLQSDFPPWLEQFPHHRNTLILIRRLASSVPSTRLNVDLKQLASQLDLLQQVFDPRTAVAWLRDRAQPKDALTLLQELFARSAVPLGDTVRHYDLLVLAGELCAKFLNQPLDAIDYFERAIGLDSTRPEAYREQLRIIAGARHHASLAAMLEANSPITSEVDAKLWRNYSGLYGARTTHGENEEEQMDDRLVALYALWRRQFELARDFVYPRLFDRQKTYIWWDFDLGLAYVQCFMGLAAFDITNLDRASQQLQQIKANLQTAIECGLFEESQVHQYGEEVAELEYRVYRAKSNLSN